MMKLIRYCFEYTEADIITDLLENNGHSSILNQIAQARKNKTCQCDLEHPEQR